MSFPERQARQAWMEEKDEEGEEEEKEPALVKRL